MAAKKHAYPSLAAFAASWFFGCSSAARGQAGRRRHHARISPLSCNATNSSISLGSMRHV